MGTLGFFQAVLPETGVYFLVRIKGRIVVHEHATSLEGLTKLLAYNEQSYPDWQMYHACGSYQHSSVIDEDGSQAWRIDKNWDRAKAFWLDIDVGVDKVTAGKGYIDKKSAAAALIKFCTDYGFPKPTIIDSGNGIHSYWALTKSISHNKWCAVANVLKRLIAKSGLLVDPNRTADFASILRPVGSTHKKSVHRSVKSVAFAPPVEPSKFWEVVKKHVSSEELKPTTPAKKLPKIQINEDLISFTTGDHSPISTISIASSCEQVAQMRNTKGDVGYEHWRGVIGIIKYSVEGEELAHEWSTGYKGYSAQEVSSKFDDWNTPPPTCSYFSNANPSGCKSCPHAGKIKSPVSLGKVAISQKEVEVETDDGQTVKVAIPDLPKGYACSGGVMVRYIANKDGIVQDFRFCKTLFYPLYRVRKDTGEYAMRMRMHLPDHKTRDFDIDTYTLAAQADLLKSLAKFEVVPMNSPDAPVHLTAYLRDSLEVLKREAKEVKTYSHFGWHTDNTEFLIGTTLFTKDGQKQVLTGGTAKKLESVFTVTGTVEGYAKGVNSLYGRSGMEPMQYMIASGFGSVLTPFPDSLYKGLMAAITGADTGKGKTTVCNTALYAFGDAERLQMSGEKGATMNARYAFLGAFKNIPVLMDELTSIDPAQMSELSYQISMGQEKHRLQAKSGAVQFADQNTWGMSPFVTANDDLHSKLAAHQNNSQAEAVRVIQVRIDNYPETMIDPEEVERYRKAIESNTGVAGRAFVEFVVKNPEQVKQLMDKLSTKLHEDIKESRLRFYRNHAICSLAAIYITNKLGVTAFDFKKLYAFTVKLLNDLAKTVKQQNTLSLEDAISDMVSAIAPMSLTTKRCTDGRHSGGDEVLKGPPAGVAPVGRIILDQNEMYITKKAVREWCKDNRIDYNGMIDYGVGNGLLETPEGKFYVGKGTVVTGGNAVCVMVKLDKVNADVTSMASSERHLKVVSG